MQTRTRLSAFILFALAAHGSAFGGEVNQATVTFDAGAQGWSINGLDQITGAGGNPGRRIFWNDPVDTFGLEVRTETNEAFIGNYAAKGEVRLGIDFHVNYIQFFGSPVSRDLVVILIDDDSFNGAPPASVWANLGTLPGTGMPWTHFSADVTDVESNELPAGWNGAGDEDPVTFEPILPAGRTWANVLQGVDRVQFTTFVPGWFFGFTHFSVSVDNISIEPLEVPIVGDLNGDGHVDGADLAELLGAWGPCPACEADFDGSGVVDGADITTLLGQWAP